MMPNSNYEHKDADFKTLFDEWVKIFDNKKKAANILKDKSAASKLEDQKTQIETFCVAYAYSRDLQDVLRGTDLSKLTFKDIEIYNADCQNITKNIDVNKEFYRIFNGTELTKRVRSSGQQLRIGLIEEPIKTFKDFFKGAGKEVKQKGNILVNKVSGMTRNEIRQNIRNFFRESSNNASQIQSNPETENLNQSSVIILRHYQDILTEYDSIENQDTRLNIRRFLVAYAFNNDLRNMLEIENLTNINSQYIQQKHVFEAVEQILNGAGITQEDVEEDFTTVRKELEKANLQMSIPSHQFQQQEKRGR